MWSWLPAPRTPQARSTRPPAARTQTQTRRHAAEEARPARGRQEDPGEEEGEDNRGKGDNTRVSSALARHANPASWQRAAPSPLHEDVPTKILIIKH